MELVLQFIFFPIGGSAAVLLTLGWSLSSSSKNSVVPPVSLATPCRSLLQARGPRPRPKHLQRWYSTYITFYHIPWEILLCQNYLHFLLLQPGLWCTACTIHTMRSATWFYCLNKSSTSLLQQDLRKYLSGNSIQKLPWVSGKRKFALIKQTELLFGHSEGSQAIWLIESLKRAGDRIIEKAEVPSAVSKKSRSVWLAGYC